MTNSILLKRKLFSENNYIRKADPKNRYWFDFSYTKLQNYKNKFGDNFNLVIAGDKNIENDFYIIPYKNVKHLFIEEYFSNDGDNRYPRWIGSIENNHLKITKAPYFDCSTFFGNIELLKNN